MLAQVRYKARVKLARSARNVERATKRSDLMTSEWITLLEYWAHDLMVAISWPINQDMYPGPAPPRGCVSSPTFSAFLSIQ